MLIIFENPPALVPPPQVADALVFKNDEQRDGDERPLHGKPEDEAAKSKIGRPGVNYDGKCVKCARIAKGLTGRGVAHVSGCSLYNPRGRNAA